MANDGLVRQWVRNRVARGEHTGCADDDALDRGARLIRHRARDRAVRRDRHGEALFRGVLHVGALRPGELASGVVRRQTRRVGRNPVGVNGHALNQEEAVGIGEHADYGMALPGDRLADHERASDGRTRRDAGDTRSRRNRALNPRGPVPTQEVRDDLVPEHEALYLQVPIAPRIVLGELARDGLQAKGEECGATAAGRSCLRMLHVDSGGAAGGVLVSDLGGTHRRDHVRPVLLEQGAHAAAQAHGAVRVEVPVDSAGWMVAQPKLRRVRRVARLPALPPRVRVVRRQ